MSGGGQQQAAPTSTTVTNTNLPAWAQPYSEKLLGQSQAVTDVNQNPYQSYQGQRTADFTGMQNQAFNATGNMQTSPQNQQASNVGAATGISGLMAGQNYNQMATNPGAMQAFMSPYQQNVTDWQKQQVVNDYARALPGQQAQATNAGAFGGSRQAIVESEGQRNLQNQLAGIQATGSQNAFQNAQQAQQFGAGLGMQGLGVANQSANLMGQMGQQNYAQQMGINAAQQQAGAQQQAFNQQGLTNQYQDFLNQQNYPYKQLGFMSDVLRGTPTGSMSSQQAHQAAPSMMSNIAGLGQLGLGAAAIGKSGLFGKEGGAVSHFAAGGIASLPNAAETQAVRNIDEGKASLDGELALGGDLTRLLMASMVLKKTQAELEVAKLANGANPQTNVAQDVAMQQQQLDQGQQPQDPTIAAESGLASLPSNNFNPENYAGGGIIAFPTGGAVESLDVEVLSDLEKIERQRVLNERIAAKEAARAVGPPPAPQTITGEDVGVKRAKELGEKRISSAERDILRGRAPTSAPGVIQPDAALKAAATRAAPVVEGIASVAPAVEAAAVPAAEAGLAGTAEAAAAKEVAKKAGGWGVKRIAKRAGAYGTAGLLAYEAGDALSDTGPARWLQGLVSKPFGDPYARSGEIAAAPTDPSPEGTADPNVLLNVISNGETGKSWNDPAALGKVARDTGNSKSYGSFGFNSQGGASSPAGRFAAAYPELGLKGNPGGSLFNATWSAAIEKNPKAMAAAQAAFVQSGYVAPAMTALATVIPEAATKDPRIVTYFADRHIQLGSLKQKEGIKAAWDASNGDTRKFLLAVNELDKANLETNFPTAIKEGIYGPKGHARRLETRLQLSLGQGAKNIVPPAPPKKSAAGQVVDFVEAIPEVYKGGKAAVIEAMTTPSDAIAAGATAGAPITPEAIKTLQTERGAVKDAQAKRDAAIAAANGDAQKAAVMANANAARADKVGDKISAQTWRNIGISLMTSGAGMLAGKSPYAMRNFGEGAEKGLAMYGAVTERQDARREATQLRQQQLTETHRKDLATEAQRGLATFQASIREHLKQQMPALAMPGNEAALQNHVLLATHNYYKTGVSPEHRLALGMTDAIMAQEEARIQQITTASSRPSGQPLLGLPGYEPPKGR